MISSENSMIKWVFKDKESNHQKIYSNQKPKNSNSKLWNIEQPKYKWKILKINTKKFYSSKCHNLVSITFIVNQIYVRIIIINLLPQELHIIKNHKLTVYLNLSYRAHNKINYKDLNNIQIEIMMILYKIHLD